MHAATEMPLPSLKKTWLRGRFLGLSKVAQTDAHHSVTLMRTKVHLFLAASRQCPSIPRRKKEENLAYDCA
jgi:hypothetical protein